MGRRAGFRTGRIVEFSTRESRMICVFEMISCCSAGKSFPLTKNETRQVAVPAGTSRSETVRLSFAIFDIPQASVVAETISAKEIIRMRELFIFYPVNTKIITRAIFFNIFCKKIFVRAENSAEEFCYDSGKLWKAKIGTAEFSKTRFRNENENSGNISGFARKRECKKVRVFLNFLHSVLKDDILRRKILLFEGKDKMNMRRAFLSAFLNIFHVLHTFAEYFFFLAGEGYTFFHRCCRR